MTIHNNFLRLPIFLLLACGSFLHAQADGGDDAEKTGGRRAWFVATSIPENLENPISVMTGKKITMITLSSRLASQPVEVPADGIIRIVRKVDDPKDPAKPVYLTLAQAIVPEGVQKSLIILGPAPKKDGSSLVFLTKIQDLARFKGGDYMFMNLTALNIAVKLGEKKVALKPGDITICEAGPISSAVNMPVSYVYLDTADSQWKLISASTVVAQPSRREICIFSWDPAYDRIDYHGVTFPVEL